MSREVRIASTDRGSFLLETSQWLPRSIDEVFPFYADAGNLETITPPWLKFTILRRPLGLLCAGSILEYRLRWHGLPLFWRTEITVWEPGERFVDVQRRGPYRMWEHEHRFVARDGGTWVQDRVEYQMFGGRWANEWIVAPDLRKIFAYRAEVLERIFGRAPESPAPDSRGPDVPRPAGGIE